VARVNGHVQIVDHFLQERRKELKNAHSLDETFELFTAELITRDHQLDWDEIDSGIVDGGNDGQIDAIYLLVDNVLIRELKDFKASATRKGAALDVIIIQSKNTAKFEENPYSKMRTTIQDIFDLGKPLKSLTNTYNSDVLRQASNFREVYKALASRKGSLSFRVVYASKGDASKCSSKMKTDKVAIESFLEKMYYKPEVKVDFIGASELIELARQPTTISKEIKFSRPPTSDGSSDGWVGLLKLTEFFRLISDEDGNLLVGLLNANVRDYEKNSDVNDEILESLQAADATIDFWRLNNGVTILCDDVRPTTQEVFHVETPLIVNGLQTTNVIWNHFSSDDANHDDQRHVLLKLIKANEEDVRARIIRSTNRQTPIQLSQLRATDHIHTDIELFFKSNGSFYERRKNQYKNEGRARNLIYTLSEVAQSVISVVLGRPDTARARPGTLLKKDEDYTRIFSDKRGLQTYLACAQLVRKAEAYLRDRNEPRKNVNNLKFYLAYAAPRVWLNKPRPTSDDFDSLNLFEIIGEFDTAFQICWQAYQKFGSGDDAAKGSQMLAAIKETLEKRRSTAKNRPTQKGSTRRPRSR